MAQSSAYNFEPWGQALHTIKDTTASPSDRNMHVSIGNGNVVKQHSIPEPMLASTDQEAPDMVKNERIPYNEKVFLIF